MNTSPYVYILGSSDATASKACDHSCFTVGDKILVDVCPTAVLSLLEAGIEPTQIEAICFTHLHSDHCMGLAPLLENIWFKKRDLSHIKIYGHKATLRKVYETIQNFFVACSSDGSRLSPEPELIELFGNNTFEQSGFEISTINSTHAVPGLCYRFVEKNSGKTICATGDTCYQECFSEFFHNADLLIHEVSYGAGPLPEIGNSGNRHSSAHEAVQAAKEANVKKMLLIHCRSEWRQAALDYARTHLDIPCEWAIPKTKYEI